jgi:cytochrome c oxidase subunit 2
MPARSRRLYRWSLRALVAAPAFLVACTEKYPRSTLAPASEFARMIDNLFDTILWAGLVVFVLVEALLVYAVLRYRMRSANEKRPEAVHGHTRLEIAWTMVPALVLIVIAVPTVRTIFVTQDTDPIPGALKVRVVGHQWWWEFDYPDLGFVTANELHVPVGKTVEFQLQSADVIHSFWVPRLGGKRDVIPPHTNRLWFTAEEPGTHPGQCAEFCGAAHALMGFRVIAEEPEDFEAWVANQRRPAVGAPPPRAGGQGAGPQGAPDDTTLAGQQGAPGDTTLARQQAAPGDTTLAGQQGAPADTTLSAAARDERVAEAAQSEKDDAEAPDVGPEDAAVAGPTRGDADQKRPATTTQDSVARTFASIGDPARGAQLAQGICAACHAIRGTNARGRIGPDLTHVASRQRIAAELLPNDPDAMARWLRNPPALKPEAKMPDLNLKEDQIADLVAYLQTLE